MGSVSERPRNGGSGVEVMDSDQNLPKLHPKLPENDEILAFILLSQPMVAIAIGYDLSKFPCLLIVAR